MITVPSSLDIVHCLTDLFVSQVEKVRHSQGRFSELRVNNFQSVELDHAIQLVSELWEEQPSRVHIPIMVKLPQLGGSPDNIGHECPIHLLMPAYCVWRIRCQKMQMAVVCSSQSL